LFYKAFVWHKFSKTWCATCVPRVPLDTICRLIWSCATLFVADWHKWHTLAQI
jgi:hypothetical protein